MMYVEEKTRWGRTQVQKFPKNIKRTDHLTTLSYWGWNRSLWVVPWRFRALPSRYTTASFMPTCRGEKCPVLRPTRPHMIEKHPGHLNKCFFTKQNVGEGVPSFFFPPLLVVGLRPKLPTAALCIGPTTGSICKLKTPSSSAFNLPSHLIETWQITPVIGMAHNCIFSKILVQAPYRICLNLYHLRWGFR